MVPAQRIHEAARRLQGLIIRTPLILSPTFSTLAGANVYLKLETLQLAGSFKVRGAAFTILSHRDEIGPEGVIAASAGNHAQGVAVAASLAGVSATIVMPENSSITKQQATMGYGARVILFGKNLTESIAKARELADHGMFFIHPYDDPDVIAGQGTCGLEILEDMPEPDLIVVPVGGGGLISGISTIVKERHPACRIVGVQSEACPSTYLAYRDAHHGTLRYTRSLADGIAVREPGRYTLPIMKSLVDDIVLVNEEEISDAMFVLMERKHVVAEGAGAAPLAALFSGRIALRKSEKVVLVISGGNVDASILERVIRRARVKRGRILRIQAVLEDEPGELARILAIIASKHGNVLYIRQRCGERNIPMTSVLFEMEIETRDRTHGKAIMDALSSSGCAVSTLDLALPMPSQ